MMGARTREWRWRKVDRSRRHFGRRASGVCGRIGSGPQRNRRGLKMNQVDHNAIYCSAKTSKEQFCLDSYG